MQHAVRRLAGLALSVALLAGLGVSPASAKIIDPSCEDDAMLHDSVSGELCATEDSPIDDSRSAKSEAKSTKNIVPRNVDPPEPRPIRTITEGQTTTFTVPNPSDRRLVTRCANFADERVAPTPQFRSDGTLVCDYSTAVEKRPGVTVSSNSISTFGPCRGPYTLEILTPDSRLEHVSGRRIRVTTSTSDNLDDTGSIEVEYFLVGTSTNTFRQSTVGAAISTSVSECTLLETVRVGVRQTSRPGMTAAVSRHAPAQEYLDTPSTTTWECTAEVIDAGVQCQSGTTISTTVQPTFPTPRGCTVVVTVAKNSRGFGSTSCLTSAQIDLYEAEIRAKHPDEQAIDVSDLPTCPESTHTDVMNALPADASGRKRCVARN